MAFDSEEHYNDAAFGYFLFFILLAALLPSTYFFVKKVTAKEPTKAPCHCPPCREKRSAKKPGSRFGATTIAAGVALVFFWIVLLLVLRGIVQGSDDMVSTEPYDPYGILGIDLGASDEEVKKAYRTLSRILHPDRNTDDPDATEKFIRVQKAHDALIDPVSRANFEKYGNPDGPQAVSIEIALPRWLVRQENRFIVLALYVIFLVILVPSAVGYWWRNRNKQELNSKVTENSLKKFYHLLEPTSRIKVLAEIVASADENKDALLAQEDEGPLAAVAKSIPEVYVLKKPRVEEPFLVKVYILLFAQMLRLQVRLSPKLNRELHDLLMRSRLLVFGIMQVSLRFRHMLLPTVECVKLLQALTQSTLDEFKQLPYFTSEAVEDAQSKKWRFKDLAAFAKASVDRRKEFMDSQKFTQAQIYDVERILKQIPVDILFTFQVGIQNEDESIGPDPIVPNSIVSVIYKIKRAREFGENGSVIDASDSDEDAPELARDDIVEKKDKLAWSEGGEQQQKKKKPTVPVKTRKFAKVQLKAFKGKQEEPAFIKEAKKKDKSAKKEEKKDDKEKKEEEKPTPKKEKVDSIEPDASAEESKKKKEKEKSTPKKKTKKEREPGRTIHSPYFPEEMARDETWWLIMGDVAKNIFVNLTKVDNFSSSTEGKILFEAPKDPGVYQFTLYLVCDGYLGCDRVETFRFTVTNPASQASSQAPQEQPKQPSRAKRRRLRGAAASSAAPTPAPVIASGASATTAAAAPPKPNAPGSDDEYSEGSDFYTDSDRSDSDSD